MPHPGHARKRMPIEDLDWYLSPTQTAIVSSEAVIVGVYGAMGEGKTFAAAVSYGWHAQRNALERNLQEVEIYVIRDTLENIKRSPIPRIREAYGGLFESFNQDREGAIFTDPLIHLSFFGVADPGDLTKLQGPEAALIHLEEVCPVYDAKAYTAGLSEAVYNAALVRCARQKNALPRLLVTGNPGDQEHWFFRRVIEPLDGPADEETPLITKATFKIPYGENVHLPDIARQATKAAYKFDLQGYKRFVGGEFVPVHRGKKVAESFNEQVHVAKEVMLPLSGVPAWRFWDSWGEPRCVMGQQLASGQLRVLDVIEDHTDVRALIPKVQARMNHPRWKTARIPEWREGGDWTMGLHDQSNKAENAAKVVEEAFGSMFERGPGRWERIKICLGTALRKATSDGQPVVLINPELRQLIAALNGRWHYAVNKSGAVTKTTPVKDGASHACDALANAIAVLQPWEPPARNLDAYRKAQQIQRQRAVGYGSGRAMYG